MRRVILLLNHGLGDVLMALPLVRRCTAGLGPGDRLLILVKSQTERAIIRRARANLGGIRVLCIAHILSGGKLGVLRLLLWLRRQKPVLFMLPHASERFQITLFAWLVGADVTVMPHSGLNKWLFGRTVVKRQEHKVRYYLRFGSTDGADGVAYPGTGLEVPDRYIELAKGLIAGWQPEQTWIGFAPGSGEAEVHKRWPPTSYRFLAKRLMDRGAKFRIAVFGSPRERELVYEVLEGLDSARAIGIIHDDILVVAAAYQLCACIVSGCSGAAHLAAAVGTTVVGLYGPTNPSFTGPHAKNRRIVRAGLRCSPCYRVGFSQGCGDPVCLSGLDVGRVEREVLLALAGRFTSEIPWHATTRARKPDPRLCEPTDEPAARVEPEEVQVKTGWH